MSGRFGGRVVLALLLAMPLHAVAADGEDDGGGPEPGLPEPAPVEQHAAPTNPVVPNPALTPQPPPPAAAAPATPPPAAPAAGAQPAPAATEAPKRLGRPFPTPVTPPPPPEDPEVHVTIIPSAEPSVGRNRIRGGGDGGAGGTDEGQAAEHPND